MDNKETYDYCLGLAKAHQPDGVLAAMFTPPACRNVLITLYALDAEFAHIAHAAKEELIAHMRYAWWEEALDGCYAGKPPAGHVVLEAWAGQCEAVPKADVMALLQQHRQHYPAAADTSELLARMAQALIEVHYGSHVSGWQKACVLIDTHRAKYGAGRNGWLQLKLLLKGLL